MSMRMRSGRCLRANSTASMPLRVCTIRCPRVSTRSLNSFMLSSLSSTMSTVLGIGVPFGANRPGRRQMLTSRHLRKENRSMRHFSKARQSVSREFGQSLAASALAFVAADPERLNRFLSLTGLGPHNLRDAAEDPVFHGSVLEYMLADEELLLRFAADSNLEPETVALARQALCGPVQFGDP